MSKRGRQIISLIEYSPDELPDAGGEEDQDLSDCVDPHVQMCRDVIARALMDAFGPEEISISKKGHYAYFERHIQNLDATHEARRWLYGYLESNARDFGDDFETESEVERRNTICHIAGVDPDILPTVIKRLRCAEKTVKGATKKQFRSLVARLAAMNET